MLLDAYNHSERTLCEKRSLVYRWLTLVKPEGFPPDLEDKFLHHLAAHRKHREEDREAVISSCQTMVKHFRKRLETEDNTSEAERLHKEIERYQARIARFQNIKEEELFGKKDLLA
jgi:primosomal protein N''